jgi:WS/DGAT/MGAT family acyltransferase
MIDGLDAVDELPEGAFAIVLKIHHAAIDGVTGAEIVTAINDQTAEPQTATAATPWKPDRVPSARELLTRAGISNVTRPLRLPGVIGRTIPAIGRVRSGVRNQEFQMPPRNSPPTRFNARVSAHRVLDARVYDLEEMKRVKSAVPGATINDVVLTIVSGAMRAYLMSKGELPHDSLTAMVPISVRTEEEKGKGGNQVSTMTTTLATDVGDPLERLKVIRTATQQSKQLSNATGARTLTDLSQALPGALLGLGSRAMSRFMRPGRGAPMTNTVVTNVPGPQMPLYLAGARLVTIYGGAPTMHGAGLINVVGSYCGSVLMQFTACREMMPDPEFYAECYDSAFEELVKAT